MMIVWYFSNGCKYCLGLNNKKHPTVHLASYLLRPCDSQRALGRVTTSLAWSPCLWEGHHTFGMISMPLGWSSCLWHGIHACGMISKPLAWSPSLWHGIHACGVVSTPLAWSPCLWRGLHAFGMVSTPLAWSPRLWRGLHQGPEVGWLWYRHCQYFGVLSRVNTLAIYRS